MKWSLVMKLTVAFVAVVLLTASLVYVTVHSMSVNELEQLLAAQEQALLEEDLRTYYLAQGNLDGYGAVFIGRSPPPPKAPEEPPNGPSGEQRKPPPPGPGRGRVGVVDIQGQVIVPWSRYRPEQFVTADVVAEGTPVMVDDVPIAYIFADKDVPVRLRAEELLYLERTNQALLLATSGAVMLALLISFLFVRTLTRPIRDLTAATAAMSNGSLGHQVRVRSQDELGQLAHTFNQMSTDLAQANYVRRQMTADIAHDLRTPLQIIGGYIESMMDGALKATPERLGTVYAEIEHLQHLVADLRMLSRADAGELRLDCAPISPHELLARVVTTYSNRAAQQTVKLTSNAALDLPLVDIDEARMVQVLSNLVDNALRYTPAGGSITLTARQPDELLQLEVADTGAGIAADDLAYLFDRFYRADQSRQEENGASGMGLAIARALVEAHGGTISAASPGLGQGAVFTIMLPLADERLVANHTTESTTTV